MSFPIFLTSWKALIAWNRFVNVDPIILINTYISSHLLPLPAHFYIIESVQIKRTIVVLVFFPFLWNEMVRWLLKYQKATTPLCRIAIQHRTPTTNVHTSFLIIFLWLLLMIKWYTRWYGKKYSRGRVEGKILSFSFQKDSLIRDVTATPTSLP